MLELGRMQTLEIVKEKDFGVYLGEPGKSAGGAEKGVLLPKKHRLVFLGHEVTPLAADEWRIPSIGLLVFKKSDIK